MRWKELQPSDVRMLDDWDMAVGMARKRLGKKRRERMAAEAEEEAQSAVFVMLEVKAREWEQHVSYNGPLAIGVDEGHREGVVAYATSQVAVLCRIASRFRSSWAGVAKEGIADAQTAEMVDKPPLRDREGDDSEAGQDHNDDGDEEEEEEELDDVNNMPLDN
ncbi:hypothetical protein BT96DRAFT_936314 [Gymnopus androsaceus JB14]|uniref:Uncharacterized protein n=1 Tax=Gymnopus androsaceus JB14 TaxID=1447944 RepID=A0A6A4I128_9AGAR|nr:hypothetical protein BT96DRAFT_936314 [Gymnopus androsaceus JB14]